MTELVLPICRRSLIPLTGVDLETGVITAVRHAASTTPRDSDILTISVTTLASSLEQLR